jgi:hypothetical protein
MGAQAVSIGAFLGDRYAKSASSAAEFKTKNNQGIGSRGAFLAYNKGDWQGLLEYSNYKQSSSRPSLLVVIDTEQWVLRGRYKLLRFRDLSVFSGLATGWLHHDYRAQYQEASIYKRLEEEEFLGLDLGVEWKWKRLSLGFFSELNYNLARKETFTALKVSGGVLLHQW